MTNQPFILLGGYVYDLIIFVLYVFILSEHIDYLGASNDGFNLSLDSDIQYNKAIVEAREKSEINITFLIGVMSLLQFARLFLFLLLTETLGTIINNTIYMVKDIANFLFIWLLIITLYSMVGTTYLTEVTILSTL